MVNVLQMSELDRISNLPDPLLSRILSLLPTKCAVATSVLSTRWEFLWTSITKLDFESMETGHSSKKSERLLRGNFTGFVNRVLLLLNPPSIQDFRLKCSEGFFDQYYLKSWISVAFIRTVRELDLCVKVEPYVELPMSRIYCNVSVLKLSGNIHFNIPSATSVCFPSLKSVYLDEILLTIAEDSCISFPNLKNLRLLCITYANEYSVHKLFSCCPVLDDLHIERDGYDEVSHLIISIPSLTKFRLSSSFDGNVSPLYKVQIDTPSLQFLNIFDNLPCEFLPAKNLSSLLKAEVEWSFYSEDEFELCRSFNKFIECLSSVKSLSLLCQSLKAIRIVSANISSSFHNLTWLELQYDTCLDLSVVNTCLGHMDNLEHLVMKIDYIFEDLVMKGWECDCTYQSWWVEPLNVPKCLLSRISTISFDFVSFSCCDQHEMLRYFLKNAEVMQMFKLTFSNYLCPEKKIKLLQKISMFPRGSSTCQVEFT